MVKWLLAIPHYIALFFLTIGAVFAAVFAWFAILFTGRYPPSVFEFLEGVIRWHNRVAAYPFLLITDRYPPFSLQPCMSAGTEIVGGSCFSPWRFSEPRKASRRRAR